MKKMTEDLEAALHQSLKVIAMEAENTLQLARRSFEAAEDTMKRLKEAMKDYQFKDETDEIEFFKVLKPALQKELFYYEELFSIESRKPIGTEQKVRLYYEEGSARINDFFDQNRAFYNYHLSKDNALDGHYYLSKGPVVPFMPVYTLDMDPHFSRPYSTRLARLMAFEQLRNYLVVAISGRHQAEAAGGGKGKRGAVWSAKVSAFVETAAALYYSGAVNYGKGGFNRFIVELADFFNLKVDNVPRIIYGMSIRKKELTPFINQLGEALQRWLEQKSL